MAKTTGTDNTIGGERTLLESLLRYLSILLKYRWLIIGVTATAAVGIVAFSVATIRLPPDKSPLPNQYTAEAIILVEKGAQGSLASSILSSLGVEPGTANSPAGYDRGSLLVMILRSRTFLDRVIEEYDLSRRYRITEQVKSKTRANLADHMAIVYDRTTASISISFTDTDPEFARDVTNRTVSLLNEWLAQNMGSSNMQQRTLLEEKVGEVKGEIDTLEKKLKALQTKYGVLTAQELGTSQASGLAELRSQLILKEIEIKNYSTFSAIEDPKLQQLKEERQNIVDLISRFQTGVPSTDNDAGDQKNLPDVQMDFNNLAVELDVQRRIYNTLSHQYEVMKLTSEPEQAFQVLELAETPDAKSGPQRTRIVMEVTLAAFAASVLLATLLHALSQIRKSTRDLPSVKENRKSGEQ